jgi:hypothetical protein
MAWNGKERKKKSIKRSDFMAKDDYFVFVYKVLSYLYDCLKGKKVLDFEYLTPLTKDFPIEEDYFNYIIENLYKEGYIDGVVLVPILGEVQNKVKYTNSLQITPKGIEYLIDNSMMEKAKGFLKTIKETVPGL